VVNEYEEYGGKAKKKIGADRTSDITLNIKMMVVYIDPIYVGADQPENINDKI